MWSEGTAQRALGAAENDAVYRDPATRMAALGLERTSKRLRQGRQNAKDHGKTYGWYDAVDAVLGPRPAPACGDAIQSATVILQSMCSDTETSVSSSAASAFHGSSSRSSSPGPTGDILELCADSPTPPVHYQEDSVTVTFPLSSSAPCKGKRRPESSRHYLVAMLREMEESNRRRDECFLQLLLAERTEARAEDGDAAREAARAALTNNFTAAINTLARAIAGHSLCCKKRRERSRHYLVAMLREMEESNRRREECVLQLLCEEQIEEREAARAADRAADRTADRAADLAADQTAAQAAFANNFNAAINTLARAIASHSVAAREDQAVD